MTHRCIGTVILFILVFSGPLWGEGQNSFDVSASVDWVRSEMNAQVSFDLAQAGIRLPAGRFLGEETLNEAYPRLLRPFLLSIRVDSSSTVGDLLEKGDVSLRDLDTLCREAAKIPPSLSADLTRMSGRYTVLLKNVSALLAPNRPPVEPGRPLIPALTADYTGIIIIADGELPIHGRRDRAFAEPCLFPKIWDTSMNLVYERNMTERALMVRYAAVESVIRPTPSGLEGELAALAGPNPLRIFSREVFGINPTDPVIDREDALKILSTEHNRRLLREGRVVLVLNKDKL